MLQKLRDKTSGWIATVVMGLLIIPFAFVGVNEYLTGGPDNAAATVQAPPTWWPSAPKWWPVSMLWQHEDVSSDEFRSQFERARQQQREAQGDNFDARAFESADNKRRVLEQVIDQKTLQLAARRAGVVVGDEAVRQSIAEEPAFQVDGKFDGSRYAALLASQSPPLTPHAFEQQQRERLQMALLPMGIGDSDFVTKNELDRVLKLLGETRDITAAALPAPAADTAEVTDAQVKQWYDSHAADFRQPEKVTLEYVDVDAAQLPAPAAPDDATLQKRYEQEKNRFSTPEQRLVSHILVAVPAGADAATQKAAQEKAAKLAAQARAPGADFAALAKADSDDTGSKGGGGDLGWVARDGSMVKPFEDALFAMQAGTVSDPVKTDFGYHVIQLRQIKPGAGKSFEEVRDQLAREQADADRERAYNELAGNLVNEVLKNPAALAPAAEALGLKVQKLGPFSRFDASGIAANPAVLRAAFSETLVQDGTVSDPIQISPTHSVLIRVLDHTQEQAQPLAQARDAVIAAIRADRTEKAAEKAADAVLARLAKGEKLQDIAAAEKLQASDVPGLPRGAPIPSPAANEAIFAAAQPAEGKPSFGKVRLQGNQYLVFVVNKVVPGDLAKITPEQREGLKQQLQQGVYGESAARAFLEATRKQFSIIVHEDRL